MPTGHAVGVTTYRPPPLQLPPLQLPVLDDRDDVAVQLGAVDSITADDAEGGPRADRATGDGARVRAAATVAAHVRLLRPEGGSTAARVSYTADDWRGRIKGAPARADARIYGAPGGPTSAGAAANSPSAVSVPTTRAGDATTPGAANSERGTARPAGHTRSAKRAEPTQPVSPLDRAARIGLLGGLVAIFVLLFIFGPRISQWWGRL